MWDQQEVTLERFLCAIQTLLAADPNANTLERRNERQQAQKYLESLIPNQTSATLTICLQLLNNGPDDEHTVCFAAILLRRALFHLWLSADDHLLKTNDPDSYDRTIIGPIVDQTVSVCFKYASEIKHRDLLPSQKTTATIAALACKKALCLSHLFAVFRSGTRSSALTVGMSGRLNALLTSAGVEQSAATVDQTVRSCQLLSEILTEFQSSDNLRALGLQSEHHIAFKRQIEDELLPQVLFSCAIQIKTLLTSTPTNLTDANIKLLMAHSNLIAVVLEWESARFFSASLAGGIHSQFQSFQPPTKLVDLFLAHDEPYGIPKWQTTNGQLINLFKILTDLYTVLKIQDNSNETISALITINTKLLARIASVKISNCAQIKSAMGRAPESERRQVTSRTIFCPLLSFVLRSVETELNTALKMLNGGTGPLENQMNSILALSEGIMCLFYNPDCRFKELIDEVETRSAILSPMVNVLNLYFQLLAQTCARQSRGTSAGNNVSVDKLCQLIDLVLQIGSYCCKLISFRLSQSEAELMSPFIKNVREFVKFFWNYLDVEDELDLDIEYAGRRGEVTVDITDSAVPEEEGGTSSVVNMFSLSASSNNKSPKFNMSSERYTARIGMLAELCRVQSSETLNELTGLVITACVNLKSESNNSNSPAQDFINFFFYFSGAILVEDFVISGHSIRALTPATFFRDIGSFVSPKGIRPILIINRLRSEELASFVTFVFERILSEDGGVRSILSPLVHQAAVIFMTRICHTYIFRTLQSDPDDQLSSESSRNSFVSRLLSYIYWCLTRMGGDPDAADCILISLRSLAWPDWFCQVHLWGGNAPVFETMLQQCLAIDGLRRYLTPNRLAQVISIITTSVLPSQCYLEFANDDKDRLQGILLVRQSEMLAAFSPLRDLVSFEGDETLLLVAVAYLQGLLKAFYKSKTNLSGMPLEQMAIMSCRRVLCWMFSNAASDVLRQPAVCRELFVRKLHQEDSSLTDELVEDTSRFEQVLCRLSDQTSVNVCSLVCTTLKWLFKFSTDNEVIKSRLARLRLLRLIETAVSRQFCLWRRWWSNNSGSDEKRLWLNKMFSMLETIISHANYYSTKDALLCDDEKILITTLVEKTALPFIAELVTTNSKSIDPIDSSRALTSLRLIRILNQLFPSIVPDGSSSSRLDSLVTCCPEFLPTLCSVTGKLWNLSSAIRCETEDLITILFLSLIDYRLIKGTTTTITSSSTAERQAAISIWEMCACSMLEQMLNWSLTERLTEAKLRTCSNIVCVIITYLATDQNRWRQSLTQSLTGLICRISPSAKVEIIQNHFGILFERAKQSLEKRCQIVTKENQSSSLSNGSVSPVRSGGIGSSRANLDFKLKVQTLFAELYKSFVIDCRVPHIL